MTDVVKPERTREIQVPIIDAIANDRPGIFQVNVPNNGAIHGIADDVVVEGKALVDASGARLLQVGELPEKLMQLVIGPRVAKAERELAAFKTGDYDLLVGCMLLDDHRTASPGASRTLDRCHARAALERGPAPSASRSHVASPLGRVPPGASDGDA